MGVLWAFPLLLAAQQAQDKMTAWAQQNPVQKVYLHMDREQYYAGETIWCKGYFMSAFLPSASNSVLYVELLNSRSQTVLRNAFPVYGGMAPAQLTLPDSLQAGLYQVRAYAPLMLNQPGFTFNRRITVYGKTKKATGGSNLQSSSRLLFFPEGGNFVAGVLNVVAFKCTGTTGMPRPVEGAVSNSKGEVVCRFKSIHDGMGSFSFVPVPGETYAATVKGWEQKQPLPPPADAGVVFNVTDAPGAKRFKILHSGRNDVFKPAYMIGQVQNNIIFKQPLQGDKEEITGSIPTARFYSGILQLTLFNKDDMPLAARITFVDNKEYVLPAAIKADTLGAAKKSRNRFTLTLPDTVAGNFSLSVTDADYETAAGRPDNIYSSFLLSSDIKGYIHNPAYYFNTPGDSVQQALDLVMMTNGWTRFKWLAILQNKQPPPLYKDPGYIRVGGTITIAGTKKPLAGKDMLLLVSPADTAGFAGSTSHMIHTDAAGRFEADSLFFYGRAKLLFSEVNGKKNRFVRVRTDGDSLSRTYPVAADPPLLPDERNTAAAQKMEAAYNGYIHARGTTLANVTVRAAVKTPLDRLDEEYAGGYFSTGAHSTRFDVRNEGFGGSIFEYLRERIPGLKIYGETGDYVLHYRGGNITYYITNGEGADPNVTLFLNEIQASAATLEGIPFSDIALIKFLPASTAAAGGGATLAVYTKKRSERAIPETASTDIITYQGYTIVKEFYDPVYDGPAAGTAADQRITLKWIPDIFINGVNAAIPVTFYNNDRTRRFKIVAEGITSDGRMLMLEKIIAAPAAQQQ